MAETRSRRVMSVEDYDIPRSQRLCLDDLAAWVEQAVRDGKAV